MKLQCRCGKKERCIGRATALKLAGAVYLSWLAYGAFKKALKPPTLTPESMPTLGASQAFAMGMALQITNPKAIAFWLAIQAVGPTQGGGTAVIAAFVVGGFVLSFLGHAFWAVALSAEGVRAVYQRLRRRIEAALGCFFLFASYKLATARV